MGGLVNSGASGGYSLSVIKMKQMVFKSTIEDDRSRAKVMKAVAGYLGVESITVDMKAGKITVVGEADPVSLATKLRKLGYKAELLSVEEKKEEKKGAEKKTEEKKAPPEKKTEEKKPPAEKKTDATPTVTTVVYHVNPQCENWPYEGYPYSYTIVRDEYPTSFCTITDPNPRLYQEPKDQIL